jgi:hypothetical protein
MIEDSQSAKTPHTAIFGGHKDRTIWIIIELLNMIAKSFFVFA